MAKIKINLDNCAGCGMCIKQCMADVLELQKAGRRNKSTAVHPENCIYCLNCMESCDYDAIKVYTDEDNPAWEVLTRLREEK